MDQSPQTTFGSLAQELNIHLVVYLVKETYAKKTDFATTLKMGSCTVALAPIVLGTILLVRPTYVSQV